MEWWSDATCYLRDAVNCRRRLYKINGERLENETRNEALLKVEALPRIPNDIYKAKDEKAHIYRFYGWWIVATVECCIIDVPALNE